MADDQGLSVLDAILGADEDYLTAFGVSRNLCVLHMRLWELLCAEMATGTEWPWITIQGCRGPIRVIARSGAPVDTIYMVDEDEFLASEKTAVAGRLPRL